MHTLPSLDPRTVGILAVGAVLLSLVATPLATVSAAVSASSAARAAQTAAEGGALRPNGTTEPIGALVTPGFLQDFEVTCGTSVTTVRPAGGAAYSIACTCPTAVSWGGTAVTTGDYSKTDFSANVGFATCIAGSATACDCVAVTSSP